MHTHNSYMVLLATGKCLGRGKSLFDVVCAAGLSSYRWWGGGRFAAYRLRFWPCARAVADRLCCRIVVYVCKERKKRLRNLGMAYSCKKSSTFGRRVGLY